MVRYWLVPHLFMHFQMGTFSPDLELKEKQRLAAKFSPYGVLKECLVVRISPTVPVALSIVFALVPQKTGGVAHPGGDDVVGQAGEGGERSAGQPVVAGVAHHGAALVQHRLLVRGPCRGAVRARAAAGAFPG